MLYRVNPSLSAYVGQEAIKRDLLNRIEAARQRLQSLPHVLLCGPREMGKSTLGNALAIEMGRNVLSTAAADIKLPGGLVALITNLAAADIKFPGDLAALITNLEDGNLLIVQDIEHLNEISLEALIQAVGDFQMNLLIGKGSSARKILLDLKRFTLVGTTSRASQVDKRLRRWMVVYNFSPYSVDEIAQIIGLIAKRESLTIDSEAAYALAEHCAGCPGNARVMLKRMLDHLDPKQPGQVTLNLVQEALLSFGYLGKLLISTDLASKVQDMNALEFEEFVADLFREMGYAVETTSKSGDHGIDLFIRKGEQLIGVQCKHWDAAVGEPVIRDFLGSLTGAGANSGYVVTSGTFTSSAYSFAQGKDVKLIDLDALVDLVNQHKAG